MKSNNWCFSWSSYRTGVGERSGPLHHPLNLFNLTKSDICRVKIVCLHYLCCGGFGLADTAPYFLIRLTDASHRCISSFKSSPLQGKVRKTSLFWVWVENWHVMYCCCFTYTIICRNFSQFVTLCKELQKIRIIYNYNDLQSIYLQILW